MSSLGVFIPKGDAGPSEDAHQKVLRGPMELRPLSFKNEDNKCVAGILNFAILPTIMACASVLQRGFVAGRQFLQNVIDLDYHSRINALHFASHANHGFSKNSIIQFCI